MQSAAGARGDHDVTDVPSIVAGAVRLGLFEAVVVLLFSLGSRLLDPPLETLVLAPILLVGLAGVTLLPGLWTRPRTIEGIAGAAGIGLGATVVFLLIDVVLLPWRRDAGRLDATDHQRGMYRALAAWAVTDFAVLVAFGA